MEFLILDSNFETISVLDVFESVIWTDRFRGYGDFEIYLPVDSIREELVTVGNYLMKKGSDRLMIIEDISIDTDTENGNHATITGRSLESILLRRVIWGQMVLEGNFQNGIKTLLNKSIIDPTMTKRKIPGFIFSTSTDPKITELTIDTQFFGENLYETIVSLCAVHDLGFRILPHGAGGFEFSLYAGTDRSYTQETNPWVVFSPNFENVQSSNYFESNRDYSNAALIAGEGEGIERQLVEQTRSGTPTGLHRREIYVDASGVSKTVDGGTLTNAEYTAQLKEKGEEALGEKKTVSSFEGEMDTTKQFVYGKDFFIGDIVQIVNEYGMSATSRVTELVQSQDVNGITTLPTFSTLNT